MQKIQLSIALIIVLTLVGCNQSPQLEGLVSASGTVMFNGTPVEGAAIIFAPVSEGTNIRTASATTGTNGRFTLMTLYPADGAFPGTYKVTVEKTDTTGNVRMDDTDGRSSRVVDTRMITDLLPLKYGDVSTTDLTVEIPPRGDRNIVLELSGEVDATPRRPDDRVRR
jgi:hypothetical protein